MKVAIIFHSFTGNTKKACVFLKDQLSLRSISVDVIELKPKQEETAFFKQGKQAFLKMRPDLEETNYDLSGYDFAIFASPVWAFTFAPALRSFLEKVKGLENKKVACFLTFGSSLGSAKALKELENSLREKEARSIFSKNLAGHKTKDNSYLQENFKSLLEIIVG